MRLHLGLSPCPNDTFIFHPLIAGLVDTGGVQTEPVMADVEEFNALTRDGTIEATKVSFAASARHRDRCAALRPGGALGRGNGPLIVARERLEPTSLAGRSVLLPGDLTTAALLFRTFHLEATATRSRPYDEAEAALLRDEADAAVIIHELRFTYAAKGLHRVEDLGQRFEDETGPPVALGGIFVRRDIKPALALDIERWIGQSLAHARREPKVSSGLGLDDLGLFCCQSTVATGFAFRCLILPGIWLGLLWNLQIRPQFVFRPGIRLRLHGGCAAKIRFVFPAEFVWKHNTSPWRISMPLTAEPTYEMFEYACHEGNYAVPNALSGARFLEKRTE